MDAFAYLFKMVFIVRGVDVCYLPMGGIPWTIRWQAWRDIWKIKQSTRFSALRVNYLHSLRKWLTFTKVNIMVINVERRHHNYGVSVSSNMVH